MITIINVTHRPIQYIGKVAGVCYGSDTSDETKNYKRGIDCLNRGHGRTFEFPDITIAITGYSNRMIRELYTHIVGVSRLQESTRYLNMSEKFKNFYTPLSIEKNEDALALYDDTMDSLGCAYETLKDMGIPKEDIGNIVPLGQRTMIVLKINLRALMNMFEIRTCTRAYKEFRDFMIELKIALSDIDKEWKELCDTYLVTKCVKFGYCDEGKGCCGRYIPKEEAMQVLKNYRTNELLNNMGGSLVERELPLVTFDKPNKNGRTYKSEDFVEGTTIPRYGICGYSDVRIMDNNGNYLSGKAISEMIYPDNQPTPEQLCNSLGIQFMNSDGECIMNEAEIQKEIETRLNEQLMMNRIIKAYEITDVFKGIETT